MPRLVITGCSCLKRSAGRWWPRSPRNSSLRVAGAALTLAALARRRTSASAARLRDRDAIAHLRRETKGLRLQRRRDGAGEVLNDAGHRALVLLPGGAER